MKNYESNLQLEHAFPPSHNHSYIFTQKIQFNNKKMIKWPLGTKHWTLRSPLKHAEYLLKASFVKRAIFRPISYWELRLLSKEAIYYQKVGLSLKVCEVGLMVYHKTGLWPELKGFEIFLLIFLVKCFKSWQNFYSLNYVMCYRPINK